MRCSHYTQDEGTCIRKGSGSESRITPWWIEGLCQIHWAEKHGIQINHNYSPPKTFTRQTHCSHCGKVLIQPVMGLHGFCSGTERSMFYRHRSINKKWAKRFVSGIKLWASISSSSELIQP